MELADALKLKKGTILEAIRSGDAQERITSGNTYTMQGDTQPLYKARGREFLMLDVHFGLGEVACNALLPIVNDAGNIAYHHYAPFTVVSQPRVQ